ncbi:hypothetical protein V6N12_073452 [Hibiscus sabdariffa]|uniref:Uncharacterized protein n=1 Tax=Hibiscus sabdariffa TaxID=183260 RepID=A0ABR2AW92_9ROSI
MPHGNLFTVTPGPVAVLIAVDQQRWEEWRMTDVPNAQGYFRRWLNAFIFCHVPGEFGSILARCEGRLLDSGGRVIGQVERGEHLGFGGFAVDDDDGRALVAKSVGNASLSRSTPPNIGSTLIGVDQWVPLNHQ